MRGINIDEYHTATDWGLILNEKSIAPPEPKYIKVSVDGRDGDLNLSRALTGDLHYNNRPLSFAFLLVDGTQGEREEKLNDIINLVHGTERKIILPEDQMYYFVGECTISDVKNDKAYGSFRLNVDGDPYRYAINETKRAITLTSTATEIVLVNLGRKRLVPTIEVSESVTLEFSDSTATLGAGTFKLANLSLPTGSTTLRVSGSGSVTFSYREAVL